VAVVVDNVPRAVRQLGEDGVVSCGKVLVLSFPGFFFFCSLGLSNSSESRGSVENYR
jgi:hypothetical protein